MFSSLGYYVDPTDYVRGVRVSYSRAMLREFNSRKPLATHFTFLRFVPLFTLRLQQHYDPVRLHCSGCLDQWNCLVGRRAQAAGVYGFHETET
jgi:hypothetical protein